MLPSNFGKYFWDVKPEDIDLRKNSSYIAERLLEFGDFEAVAWLLKTYGREFLEQVIEKSKCLSSKSANFYSIYFGIDPKKILCLQGGYRNKQRKIWNH